MRIRNVVIVLATLLLSLAFAGTANASLVTKLMVGKDGGIGGLGLGFGQLIEPRDADIGPDGEIYVLVADDCSVRVFSPTGTPLRTFGGCPAFDYNASGNELFSNPLAITVDAKSRVYVSTSNYLTITDRDGTVLDRFGTTSGSVPFTTYPMGAAVTDPAPDDPDGSTWLFVSNGNANRVERYSIAYDDNAVSFDWAAGVDVDSTDGNTGYEVCTVYANCKTGISDGPVGFATPRDMDIATPTGPLLVANPYNLIARVDPDTGAKVGATTLSGGVSAISLAARSDGGLWVGPPGEGYAQILAFDSDGMQIDAIGTYATPSSASDGIGAVFGLGSASGGTRLAGADYTMNRVGVYDETGNNLQLVGKNDGIGWAQGSGPGEFAGVTDVASDGGGGFWALDSGNKRIVRFDNTGAVTQTILMSSIGSQTGISPNGPQALGINSSGTQLYVADSWNFRIIRFDVDVAAHTATFNRMAGRNVDSVNPSTGSEICTVVANCQRGVTGADPQSFNFPLDVTVAPNGAVWVVEQNNSRIQRFDSLLNWGSTIGASGGTDGNFQNPQSIAFESDNSFWVNDLGPRIQKFDSSGVFVKKFGVGFATPAGTFGVAQQSGLAVVGSNLFIVEPTLGRVAIYPTSTTGVGALLPASTFGAPGSNAGQFYKPRGITAIGSDILVADSGNSRVQWIGEDAGAPPAGTITVSSPAVGETFINKSQIRLDFSAVNPDGDEMTCTPAAGSLVPLPSVGSNTIHVACDDPLNAADVTKDVEVTRVSDNIAPTVVIDTPVDGSTVTSSPVTLVYDASDDQDLGPLDCDRTTGSSINLTPGLNTITVSCEDWAGNIGSASATVTYTPPKLPDPPAPPASGGGNTASPAATIKFPKKLKFKGKVTATITCDMACPLVFSVSAKVGRKTYKSSAKGALAAAGSLKLTAKFKSSATRKILAAKKLPKLKYTLSYGAKAGKSGSVKMSR